MASKYAKEIFNNIKDPMKVKEELDKAVETKIKKQIPKMMKQTAEKIKSELFGEE